MADIAIFRINYKSDFILTLNSDAGWMTPFCIKFWTGAPSQAYFVGYDGTTYTHCAPVDGEPTKLRVQFDDHHLPIGDLKFQIAYHFTVADFPTSVEDEVINQASVIIEVDDTPAQVMLDFNGETAPEIEFSLPAYANEAQRITNEEQRIANEEQRIANEEARIAAETIRQQNEAQRISNEESRVTEFARLKRESEAATDDANAAATLANEKAALADDKAALADAAATLANEKAQLAADKAALAQAAATLANEKAALAQQKAAYAQTQGDYAKAQGDYAKAQGDTAQADHVRAEADHTTAADDHTQAADDHETASSDHSRAEADHTTAASDNTRAEVDHSTASADHTTATNDHTQAVTDHSTATSDHTQADNDHTRAESDHTRAESDHAAVEVYVDSLGVFDLSKHNAIGGVLATYADLGAALNALNALDSKYKYGGMSFKFVHTNDNKYVQYLLKAQSFSTEEEDWEKMNLEKELGNLDVEINGTKINLYKGNINSTSGFINNYYSNFCYSDVLNGPFSIKVNNDYYIYNIWKFTNPNDTTGAERIVADTTKTLVEYTVSASGYYRVCIQRKDTANFTFDANNKVTENVIVPTDGLKNTKQNVLVSGENIKTIDRQSIVGSGDLDLNDIKFTEQTLTELQKKQARENIGVASEESVLKRTDLHTVIVSNNLANPADIVNGWVNTEYKLQLLPSNAWRSLVFDCTNYRGQNITFGGSTIPNTVRYAFYAGTTLSTHANPNTFAEPVTVMVPNDADVLYITIARYDNSEYAQFRLNLGSILLAYDQYTEKIDKITGKELSVNIPETTSNYNKAYLLPKADLSVVDFQFDWGVGADDMVESVVNLAEINKIKVGIALGGVLLNTTEQAVIEQYLKYQEAGHSILNHPGVTPITISNFPTPKDAYDHMIVFQRNLISYGFKPYGFVAPQSSYDKELIRAVEAVWAYGSTYYDNVNWQNNTKAGGPYLIRRSSLEAFTKTECKRRIIKAISDKTYMSFYGHVHNMGTSGASINSTLTIQSVDITSGSGTIIVKGNISLNPSTASTLITRLTGSGDETITVSNITIDSTYSINTLTVSGVTNAPVAGDTYQITVSDVWNLEKLGDIMQFVATKRDNLELLCLPPDEAAKQFYNM